MVEGDSTNKRLFCTELLALEAGTLTGSEVLTFHPQKTHTEAFHT